MDYCNLVYMESCKHMTKGRGIVNALTNVRISALKNPSRYLGNFDLNSAVIWLFIYGIWAVATFIELILGYTLAKKFTNNKQSL